MITNTFIKNLYLNHKDTLGMLRKKMKKNHSHGIPQYDDIEAEITSLLLLNFKPKNVIEFSPCTGYSTSIILNALEINNNGSQLKSFDLTDKCSNYINSLGHKNVDWRFEAGDVSEKFKSWDLNKIDYLFIDSDHSTEFAKKFVNDLLRPLLKVCRNDDKEVLVSVHDIYHGRSNEPLEEGRVVVDFLSENNIEYYTPAKCLIQNYYELINLKKKLGMNELINNETNPSIFFILK